MEDYIILSSESDAILAEKVLAKSKQGYKLAGGLQAIYLPGARFVQFFQAMYKEEDMTDDSF